jgi:hypothetical protein
MWGKPRAFWGSPPRFSPPLAWKAEPSSRAEGISQRATPRKGEEVVKKLEVVDFHPCIFNDLRCPESPIFEILSRLRSLSAQQAAEPLWDLTLREL